MKLVGISVLAMMCLLVASVTCQRYAAYGGYGGYGGYPRRNNSWFGILPLLFLLFFLPFFNQNNDQLVLVNSTLNG